MPQNDFIFKRKYNMIKDKQSYKKLKIIFEKLVDI